MFWRTQVIQTYRCLDSPSSSFPIIAIKDSINPAKIKHKQFELLVFLPLNFIQFCTKYINFFLSIWTLNCCFNLLDYYKFFFSVERVRKQTAKNGKCLDVKCEVYKLMSTWTVLKAFFMSFLTLKRTCILRVLE